MIGPWRMELAAAVGAAAVVVGFVLGEDRPQVAFAEDEHPVGELGPGGEHEPFRVGVRARVAGRDLHGPDPGVGQDGVERVGELPGPVTDQVAEVRGAVTEVHQEVAGLLRGPGPVRVGGDAKDVHGPGADLDDEQAVQALQGNGAVDVEEVGREYRGCLGA